MRLPFRFFVLQMILGTALLLPWTVETKARELWRNVSTSISLDQNTSKCGAKAWFIIQTNEVNLFEERLKTLQSGIDGALSNYTFNCKDVQSIVLTGKVASVVVFSGNIEKSNNWRVSVKTAPLEKDAGNLSNIVKSLADVGKISATLSRYDEVPGIKDTFQYFIYTDTAKKLVQSILNRDGGREFKDLIEQTYERKKSAASLKWEMRKVINSVSLILPDQAQKLTSVLEENVAVIVREEWDNFIDTQLALGSVFDVTLSKIAEKADLLEPEAKHGEELDHLLVNWLKNEIHSADNKPTATYQETVANKNAVITALGKIDLPDPFTNSRELITAKVQRLEIEANDIEWNGFLDVEFEDGDIFENTLSNVAAKAKNFKPHDSVIGKLDQRLEAWIGEELEIYKSLTDGGYLTDVAEREKLSASLFKAELPGTFPKAQEFLKSSYKNLRADNRKKLDELTSVALEIIITTGDSFEDIDLIVEEAVGVSSEFEENGFESRAQQILKASGDRIDSLVEAGNQTLKTQLQSASMTREAIASYQEQAALFDELSEQFDGFKSYVVTIEDGIAAGRSRECLVQLKRAVNDDTVPELKIGTTSGALDLKDLACKLYANDHILTEYKQGWFWWPSTLSIDRAGGSVETFKLDDDSDTNTYVGVAKIDGEDESALDRDAWYSYLAELTIPPPSGKPNARGITECDLLAADPNDAGKLTDGVDLEKQTAEHDFDRAIDACIAAIEYTPEQPRNYYQLARLLGFLGMEEAGSYAEIALNGKYPAAYFLAAEMKMMEESDDAFFDAIDYLKEGAKLGYAPAKQLLEELVPPGTEFYRELPEPTASEILSAINTRNCAGFMGMSMCVNLTGVRSKSCFQTSATDFSCELIFNLSCETSRDPLLRLFQNFCPPVSDPQFKTIRKLDNGRWREM